MTPLELRNRLERIDRFLYLSLENDNWTNVSDAIRMRCIVQMQTGDPEYAAWKGYSNA